MNTLCTRLAVGVGLLAIPSAAHAQTAVETVAFITLGIEAARSGTNSMGDVREFEMEGDHTINWKLTWGSGRVVQELMIYEEDDCQFRIMGQDFTTVPYERNFNLDISLDFTNISPTQNARRFTYPGQSNYWYFYEVNGVEVCNNGETAGGVGDRMPEAGVCRATFETDTFAGTNDLARIEAALNHLRNNYCKARAF